MQTPPDRTVNKMLEERRKELIHLMAGALRHLGVDKHDISVIKRRGVDVFDPDTAVFLVKTDTDPVLSPEDVSFIAINLKNMSYEVKRIEHRGERLLLFV
jgi:hypothetical protein